MTISIRDGARLVGDEIGTHAVLSAMLTHMLVQDAHWAASLGTISTTIDEHIRRADIPASADFDREEARRAASDFASSIVTSIRSRLHNVGVE